MQTFEGFRRRVAELCEQDLEHGDVASFPNFSDALSTVLSGVVGELVTDASHFTTGDYIHSEWCARTGSKMSRVPLNKQGFVPTEQVAEALTKDTAVVSISHVCWKNGYVHDLDFLAKAIVAVCPDALFIVDGYQSLGTVPMNVTVWPERTAILGGGIKQLRAGTGAGFGWFSNACIESVRPTSTGWWAHADPLAFEEQFRLGTGAARFRTGTPDLTPMAALVGELNVLASFGGGKLSMAIERVRKRTQHQVTRAIEYAQKRGLQVASPRNPEERAAFFAIAVDDGPGALAWLADAGIIVDFRANQPGSDDGLIRISAHSSSFEYELLYAVEWLSSATRAAQA